MHPHTRGVMGAIGAVMSAVNDALAPFGVHVDRQPLRPASIRSLLGGKDAVSTRSVVS